MRLIGAASTVFALVLSYVVSGFGQSTIAQQLGRRPGVEVDRQQQEDGESRHRDGQAIFRFDTFGDEQLWTDVLRMHEPIATLDPATALAVGLKVDVDALPPAIVAALRAGQVDLTSPAVTTALLRLNAVVGVKGTVERVGPVDQRRHHVRVVPLDGRQLVCAWDRQAAGWMGESGPECGGDRRAVAGVARYPQGRVPHVGPRQDTILDTTRSTARTSFR